jgi:hypothetical protein
MGQKKGNPIPSYQNQGYETLYPNTGRDSRDMGTKPVMIDDQTTLDAVVDSGSLKYTQGYAKDTDLTDGTINARFDTLTANEYYVTIYSSSILFSSGSTFLGDSSEDTHRITGSLYVSGESEFGGDLVPKTARGGTIGTLEKPFRDIYIQSASINIASDTPGAPNTTISNIGGNLLISAGGMRLLGSASFIAQTGSFNYLSGSFKNVGIFEQEGATFITGAFGVSGSTIQIGNNLLTGTTTLSGSVKISGSLDVFGHVNFNNCSTTMTGSLLISGSTTQIGNTQLTGSLNVTGSVYVNGNKQYNYGAFYDTTTQSGSINTAYPMKLNTTDMGVGVSVVNGSQITVSNTGTYNLQFSAQLVLTNTGVSDISIWLRKDGTNVAGSAGDITIERTAGGGKQIAAWNYLIQLNANQYVELMWSTTNANTQIAYTSTQTNPTRPETPSVIVTLTQVA